MRNNPELDHMLDEVESEILVRMASRPDIAPLTAEMANRALKRRANHGSKAHIMFPTLSFTMQGAAGWHLTNDPALAFRMVGWYLVALSLALMAVHLFNILRKP